MMKRASQLRKYSVYFAIRFQGFPSSVGIIWLRNDSIPFYPIWPFMFLVAIQLVCLAIASLICRGAERSVSCAGYIGSSFHISAQIHDLISMICTSDRLCVDLCDLRDRDHGCRVESAWQYLMYAICTMDHALICAICTIEVVISGLSL